MIWLVIFIAVAAVLFGVYNSRKKFYQYRIYMIPGPDDEFIFVFDLRDKRNPDVIVSSRNVKLEDFKIPPFVDGKWHDVPAGDISYR